MKLIFSLFEAFAMEVNFQEEGYIDSSGQLFQEFIVSTFCKT